MPAITPDLRCRHPLAADTALAINFGLVSSQSRNLTGENLSHPLRNKGLTTFSYLDFEKIN